MRMRSTTPTNCKWELVMAKVGHWKVLPNKEQESEVSTLMECIIPWSEIPYDENNEVPIDYEPPVFNASKPKAEAIDVVCQR